MKKIEKNRSRNILKYIILGIMIQAITEKTSINANESTESSYTNLIDASATLQQEEEFHYKPYIPEQPTVFSDFSNMTDSKPAEDSSIANKNSNEDLVGKPFIAFPVVGRVESKHSSELIAENETSPNFKPTQEDSSLPEQKPEPTQAPAEPHREGIKQPPSVPLFPFIPALDTENGPRPTIKLIDPSEPKRTSQPLQEEKQETPTTNTPLILDKKLSPTEPTSKEGAKSNKDISVNFNNISMIEYVRFVSRLSNKNFIFDENDLLFNVTIVSEEPTSVENLMAALLQELKIRELSLIEQGNNIIIHKNRSVRAPAHIVTDEKNGDSKILGIITRVFRLNTLDPNKASEIIKPLLSDDALVEVLRDSNNLIITDIAANIEKVSQLIKSLDAPNSGITVGQYVVSSGFVDSLVDLATKILQPIAQGNPFVLVPHNASNSIFIVSNPFLVEKAIAILESLDMNEGRTKILNLEQLRTREMELRREEQEILEGKRLPGSRGSLQPGQQPSGGLNDTSARAIPENPYRAQGQTGQPGQPGQAGERFGPGGIGTEGHSSAIYPENRTLAPGGISPSSRWAMELPAGHIERTMFFIYKLKYRKGDQIEMALNKIAITLQATGKVNEDLVGAITSSQWIEASNSLIFTGTSSALERVKELIIEIDVPLHQVFIEMLILDTTIDDSLAYGVDFGTRFGGGNTAGGQAFLGLGSTLSNSIDGTAPVNAGIKSALNVVDPSNLFKTDGYSLGVIGKHLTHGGVHFATIGALVQAIHTDQKINIVLNPKIITEDNSPAEIFVGSTDRYKTQSIANDQGNTITNNFQFVDVGTTLRVTPLIGNNGIITLDIIEEVTNALPQANTTSANPNVVDVNLVPVLSKSRTTTRIHIPNGFFVIMSGLISDQVVRKENRIPCLGGIPIIGGISKQRSNNDSKRNLMIFLRPLIVDTEEELENISKRQQDVYKEKCKFKRSWNYEIDEALDWLNIKSTNSDDAVCPF